MPELEDDRGASAAFGRRCVVGAALLWSIAGAATKAIAGLDGVTIAFYRSLFAGLALWPFVPRARWVARPAMLPMVLSFAAMIGLFLAATKATTAANAIYLQCTGLFWMIPAGALFLGERPDRRSILGIALATLGIAWIVLGGHHAGPSDRLGIALGLASGVAYAGVTISLRGLRDLDPTWLSAINNLGGSLIVGAWLWATSGRISVPTSTQLVELAAFGVVQMAIPYILFARGLREIGAPEAGLIALLEPVLNPVWAFLVVGEIPEPATLQGGLFLLAGVACRYGFKARKFRSP